MESARGGGSVRIGKRCGKPLFRRFRPFFRFFAARLTFSLRVGMIKEETPAPAGERLAPI